MKPIGPAVASCVMLILYFPLSLSGQRLVPPRKYHHADDDDDIHHDFSDDDEELDANTTDNGAYIGAPCENVCSPKLMHVYCNPINNVCECEKNYPVKLNPSTGCGKPKRLGEQCYYREACQYTDQHSACIQIHHNAICQCEHGYHSVSIQKPSKRVFCAEDLAVMTTDFSTFAGVLSGIAILSGLICFVLKLFNQNMYGDTRRRHRFGNANLAPPILFSSDPGSLPMPIIIDRSMTSRTSSHRTLASIQSRRASLNGAGCSSSGGVGGTISTARHYQGPNSSYRNAVSVSASRAGAARAAAILLLSYCHNSTPTTTTSSGLPPPTPSSELLRLHCLQQQMRLPKTSLGSRRPSMTSIHSSTSVRSYSARRYEREREQKEEREMQRRLARMTSSANSSGRVGPPTPSPHSTDDLLPTLEEDKQSKLAARMGIVPPLAIQEESSSSFHEEIPSTSKQFP